MSNNLILYRKKYRITQDEIAKEINKSRQSASAKELGKVPYNQEEMYAITKLIKGYNPNVTVEDIFFKDLVGETPIEVK